MRKVFLFVFMAIMVAAVATVEASAQAKTVAGEWDGAFETPGGARPFKLVLKVDGEKLSGVAKRSSGDAAITGTIKGKDVVFSYTISYNGNDLTMSFTGKFDGDAMTGTVSFGGNAEEPWNAKRAPTEKPKAQ